MTEIDGFDLGWLGLHDCRFYGTKTWCTEDKAYAVNLWQIAVPSLGDNGASLIIQATKVEPKSLSLIETELEEVLNGV